MTLSIEKLHSGVISGKADGYCGWPTLIRSAGGDLLAVCSGNREAHVCPFGRVLLYRSTDGGHSWSAPQQLSGGPLDDRDAGICQCPDGTLLVNYFTSICALVQNRENVPEIWQRKQREITLETLCREHGFWMRRSTDNGRSWSEKYPIPVNSPHGPTVLNDGSLLFVGKKISSDAGWEAEGSRHGTEIVAARSDDNGANWKILSVLPMAPGHDPARCYEPYAIQTADGRIIAAIRDHARTPKGETWQTESDDGGLSWSTPHLLHDGFPVHFVRCPGNRLLMTYGYRNQPFGIRVRVSDDGTRSWSGELILYDEGECHDLGYPTTAVMPDGSFCSVWYEWVKTGAVLKYCCWKLQNR